MGRIPPHMAWVTCLTIIGLSLHSRLCWIAGVFGEGPSVCSSAIPARTQMATLRRIGYVCDLLRPVVPIVMSDCWQRSGTTSSACTALPRTIGIVIGLQLQSFHFHTPVYVRSTPSYVFRRILVGVGSKMRLETSTWSIGGLRLVT
jgi:hypothetical protein